MHVISSPSGDHDRRSPADDAFRRVWTAGYSASPLTDETDGRNAVRGVAVAVGISVVFWLLLLAATTEIVHTVVSLNR